MADRILPSKLISERVTVSFDFLPLLLWGELISTATIVVSVTSGYDERPQYLLYSSADINGSTVSHQVWRGLPGVVYNLACNAAGSSGTVYTLNALIAILPDDALNPPLAATFFNSQIYPIEYLESYSSYSNLYAGEFTTNSAELFKSGAMLLDGTLRIVEQVYAFSDMYRASSMLMDGTLVSVIKTYSFNETYRANASLLAGTLVRIIVTYDYRETYRSSAALLNGTLV